MSFIRSYPVPPDEEERLRALEAFAILDTPPEQEFDRIVQMASRVLEAPIALVSLVHRDRQFYKAKIGQNACESDREVSFCAHAIMDDEVLFVPDATQDPRFQSNILVTGEPFIRFYAGAPLVSPSGHRIGAVCLIDSKPRPAFSPRDCLTLQDFAAFAMERIELRRMELAKNASRDQFQNIAAASPDAIICADGRNVITSWNRAAERIFGYSATEAIGRSLDIIVPPGDRSSWLIGLAGGGAGMIGVPLTFAACRRDGTEFPIELSLSQWRENGERNLGAIVRDITERKQVEDRLKRAAEFDHLTGLANRSTLFQRMKQTCAVEGRATVLLIDLDGFTEVNDTFGHSAGDQLLKIVAARIRAEVDVEHVVARLGGDEFVVFLDGVADPIIASALADRLLETIKAPIDLQEQSIHIGTSVGIATRLAGQCDAEQLLGNADLALYQAKADGRQLVRIFTQELRSSAAARGAVNSGLRAAWEHRQFELYYQPQFRLADGVLTGAEALLRWNHPEHGLVLPGAFLPVLETGLLAAPVGNWILRQACRQAAKWRRDGLDRFRIGVNLFAVQFRDNDFAGTVEKALGKYGLPPEMLELEITENIILRNEQRIAKPLRYLREMGVGIAFDDFGTGFASLSMLKDYPVTRLKIDRSFVSGVDMSGKDRAIVESVTRLAKAFDLDVIAEGIETAEQAAVMREHGCEEGQGYLFGRPMTATAFEQQFCGARSEDAHRLGV